MKIQKDPQNEKIKKIAELNPKDVERELDDLIRQSGNSSVNFKNEMVKDFKESDFKTEQDLQLGKFKKIKHKKK